MRRPLGQAALTTFFQRQQGQAPPPPKRAKAQSDDARANEEKKRSARREENSQTEFTTAQRESESEAVTTLGQSNSSSSSSGRGRERRLQEERRAQSSYQSTTALDGRTGAGVTSALPNGEDGTPALAPQASAVSNVNPSAARPTPSASNEGGFTSARELLEGPRGDGAGLALDLRRAADAGEQMALRERGEVLTLQEGAAGRSTSGGEATEATGPAIRAASSPSAAAGDEGVDNAGPAAAEETAAAAAPVAAFDFHGR
jgi:hypothetical protein